MRVPPRGRDTSKLQGVHPNKNTPDAEQVLDFIHTTMETLNEFKKHFEKHQLTVTDPFGYVSNLTKIYFTYYDFKLLNKHLNFIPNPGRCNTNTFEKDKNTFFRNMILKSHFGNNQNRNYAGYKNKTNKDWLPKNTHHTIKTFIESVHKDLGDTQQMTYQRTSNNLTRGEIHSLHKLVKRDDIIVTKADKGGAVVLINVDDYMKEAKRQQDNTEFYTQLNVNPTTIHNDIVNKTIRDFAKDKLLPDTYCQSTRCR